MRHRDDARLDGIVCIDEIEDDDNDELFVDELEAEHGKPHVEEEKSEPIKILSNVKLPTIVEQPSEEGELLQNQAFKLEPSSEAEALSNVASGIATSLGLVDVVVLDDNQQYIISSNGAGGKYKCSTKII